MENWLEDIVAHYGGEDLTREAYMNSLDYSNPYLWVDRAARLIKENPTLSSETSINAGRISLGIMLAVNHAGAMTEDEFSGRVQALTGGVAPITAAFKASPLSGLEIMSPEGVCDLITLEAQFRNSQGKD